MVADATIVEAVKAGNFDRLRGLARQEIRFGSAQPLCTAVGIRDVVAMVRFPVKELGADVRQTFRDVSTDGSRASMEGDLPLFIAAMGGNLYMIRCLVNELGADVNQATETRAAHSGTTSLMVATQGGYLNVVR
jgi:hypothetical protein